MPRLLSPLLPPLPTPGIEVRRDLSPPGGEGFLTLRRVELSLGGGEPFVYDTVERRALDAVVICAWYRGDGGGRRVYLRSSVRPPLALRPTPGAYQADGVLWELPAGLIDLGETPAMAAARELAEELGFRADAAAMHPLGPAVYPSPAWCGEEQHFFAVEVDPRTREEPKGDGSALEQGATVTDVTLAAALALCNEGVLRDAKTELALRRFEASRA